MTKLEKYTDACALPADAAMRRADRYQFTQEDRRLSITSQAPDLRPTLDPVTQALRLLATEHAGEMAGYARKAGISHKSLRDWKHGSHSPTLANLTALLNAMGYQLKVVPMEKRDV